MKKSLSLFFAGITLAMFATPLRADDLSNNLTANINQQSLDVLAKDLGALMGGGSFHQGKSLGFPLGFDIGAHVPVVGLHDDDVILRDDGSTLQAVWGQAEIGLPGKINLIGRYGKLLDANMIGGGLRFGLFSPSVPGIPALSVSGLYSKMTHDYLDLNTISVNAVLSLELPFIHPYLGGGYDHTKLEPTAQAFSGAPVGVSRSLEGSANGYRVEAGINVSLLPFTYLTLAGGLANGQKMYHAGAGVKF